MKSTSVNKNKVFNVGNLMIGLTVAATCSHPDPAEAQAAINIGSAARFAVLAATEVTDIPTSAMTGDVGLSPAAMSYITGLTSPQVVGSIYAASEGGATAIMLTKAHGDLTTAYNTAAGLTPVPTGPFLNPGGGNMGGLNLPPGLYKFTSGASISGSALTLTGNATNVWIFQIASTLTVDNGMQVTLAGGAQAANIFWQVSTSAALGTTTIFEGTIMAHDSITFDTGATLNGRALAETAAVTLASTTITVPNQLAAPPIFGGISLSSNGNVTLVIDNTPNFALTLQTSTDLINWTTLATPTPSVSPYTFIDNTSPDGAARFYRVFYP
jgi:hypothetical protein